MMSCLWDEREKGGDERAQMGGFWPHGAGYGWFHDGLRACHCPVAQWLGPVSSSSPHPYLPCQSASI